MLLNSHISAYTRCLAGKVCGLVRSTWGTARDKILHTKVAHWANIPPWFNPSVLSPLLCLYSCAQTLSANANEAYWKKAEHLGLRVVSGLGQARP